MIFDGLFLILFSNNNKHPGQEFSFLISQVNFEVFRYPKSRCNKTKQKTKNEDTKKQMGIQQKTQKQKESLNTHMKNIRGTKYSTEDSAPNSSIKFKSKFSMTSRLPTFKLQNLNLQANIPSLLFYYLIV